MKILGMIVAGAIVLAAQAGLAATLSNNPTGGNVSTFGWPDSQTYGQVFVAPVTGTLDSFTMHLGSSVGDIVGAVGTWNGPASHGFGFGSDTTLYQSAATASVGGANTFTPGISVTAGNIYVAFLTVFGLNNTGQRTFMPLGDGLAGGGYFVWNNADSPFGDGSWNYFFQAGSALFSANFTPSQVPLPAGIVLLIGALGGLALVARRRDAA
jgi:hypothetical protein